MIKKIILNSFGKFSEKSFKFSDITVFYGENEAGKTTIQDAVFYALCKPSGTKSSGRELKKRYGDMDAVVDPQNAYDIDEEEFRHLFSIKAGDISIEISDSAQWMKSVKSHLFTGGINPDILVDSLRKKSATSKTLLHMKKFTELSKEEEKLTERIEKLLQEKNDINAKGEGVAGFEKRISEIKINLKNIAEEKHGLNEQLILMEKIREKNHIAGILKSLSELENGSSRLNEISGCNEENLKILDGFENDLRSEENKLIALKAKKDEVSENLALINKKISLQNAEALLLKKKFEKAVLLLDRIFNYKQNREPTTVRKINYMKLVLALFLFAASSAGWILSIQPEYIRYILAAVSAGLSIYLIATAFESLKSEDDSAEKEYAARLKDEWNSDFSEMIPSERIEALESFFYRVRADYEGRADLLAEIQADADRINSELSELQKTIAQKEAAVSDKKDAVKAFLLSFAVKSRDDFTAKMNEKNILSAGLNKLKNLPDLKGDHDKIREDCDSRLRVLNMEGIPSEGYDEMKSNRLKMTKQSLDEKMKELQDEDKNLSMKKESISGEVKGGLKGVLDELYSLENNLKKIRKEQSEIEFNRKAAELAAEIFTEVKNKSDDNFSAMEQELEKYSSKIFPDDRNVSIKGLDPEKIFIKDAGGVLRTVSNLSSGTKDSFVFAARLALASKVSGEKAILVFDDPFLHLDEKRTEAAVKMLHEFQKDNDWQILFFTKEKSLRDRLKKTFDNCLVHDLQ